MIRELDDFCRKLQAKGFHITQMPRMMPWGWRHAYLNDPDAHEISLYWAGENRMKKTVMRTAKEVDKVPAANGLIEKIPKPKPDFSNLGTLPQSPRDELCRGL